MNRTIYTLIIYTPGEQGSNNRWGEREGGKDSYSEISYHLDKKSIGELIAHSEFEDHETQITVLIDGKNPDEYHDFISKEEQKTLTDELDEIQAIAYEKRQELIKEKKERIEEENKRKLKQEELKKEEQKKKAEAVERAQLAKLMAKYPQ